MTVTNLGVNPGVVRGGGAQTRKGLIGVEAIIHSHRQCGADDRGLRDFGFEELPSKGPTPNSAFFYCMVTSFFLFETFKEDVSEEVTSVASYATTVRRRVVDFAARNIRTSRGVILKVTQAVMDNLRFNKPWGVSKPSPISV
jgi:hypothetical protein